MIKRTTLITVLVAAFATAAPAYAQSGNAYGGEGNVLGELTQGTGNNTNGTGNNTNGTGAKGDTEGTPRGVNGPAGNTDAAATAASHVSSTTGSSLPFTGFDVLLLIAGGVALVGVGAAMRRLTAAP